MILFDNYLYSKSLQLLYLNPTGANPTGLTISTKRKREIYKIACEYNLLILEDDPYYFLHFEEVTINIL